MLRPRCALLAVLIGVGVATPAHAAVTASNVTSPADGSRYLITDTSPQVNVPLTGTSNGTTGDTVDIRCYIRADDYSTGTSNVPVAANGSFSTTFSTGDPYGTCVLRAVPHNLPQTSDASAFTGPALTTEWNQTTKIAAGPNAGKVVDFYVLFQGAQAMNDYVSATAGGLWDSRLQYSAGRASALVWYENAALTGNEGLSTGNRSFLQVDGRNAYGPDSASQLFENNPGLPALTYDASRDPGTGNTTIHETNPIVVCPNETPFPPTAGSCPQFSSAGVELQRTLFADDGGRQVHIMDTWRSTDGAAHTISPHYDQWLRGNDDVDGTVPVGLRLPWVGDFQTFTTETVFPGAPAGAGSLFVRSNNNFPSGSEKYPIGGLSFDIAPSAVRRGTNQNFTLRDENVTVPAGGAAVVREDFVLGQTQAEVDAKAAANVDRFVAPTVSISSPANASTIKGAARTKKITVTGSASDNQGVASLTLNGASIPLAANGTFAAPARVALGKNTLTVVARDGAGNSATASATVGYVDNVNPAVRRFTADPNTFRVGAGRTPVATRAKAGTTFKFRLSEAAKVAIKISRVRHGKRKRLVARGTLRRTLGAGKRKVKFTGRIGKKKLAPGRYVATIRATDYARHKSKKKSVKLHVVRR